MTLGRKIKQLNKARGKRLAHLARRVGVSIYTMSMWANDHNTPNQRNLRSLADALETTVDYLLDPSLGEPSGDEDRPAEVVIDVDDGYGPRSTMPQLPHPAHANGEAVAPWVDAAPPAYQPPAYQAAGYLPPEPRRPTADATLGQDDQTVLVAYHAYRDGPEGLTMREAIRAIGLAAMEKGRQP